MNTLEMMIKAKKFGKKFRLPIWSDKNLYIFFNSYGKDYQFEFSKPKNMKIDIFSFLEETTWVEYIPKVMFSQLKYGAKFKRLAFDGEYTKINPIHVYEYKLYMYIHSDNFTLHEDEFDFEVEEIK